jgi:hypothetical protein
VAPVPSAQRPAHNPHTDHRPVHSKEHRHGKGFEEKIEKTLARIEPELRSKGHHMHQTRISGLDLMFCSKIDPRYAAPYFVNNSEITPLRNTAVRKDHTISSCRCADTGQFLPLGTRRYTVIASCAVLSLFNMIGYNAKVGGLLMYQTDNPNGGFFHLLDFFGPGATGQGLDAWSLNDLLGSDGSSISSNGFNWSLEFGGTLMGTDFTKSGIIRHFEIPVGSLVTAQGSAELSIADLLTSVKSM